MEAAEIAASHQRQHTIDCAYLSVVLEGVVRACGDGSMPFDCDAGSVLWHPPGHRADTQDVARGRVLWIAIPELRFREINGAVQGALSIPHYFPGRDLGVHQRRLELEWRRAEPSPLLFEAAALAMMGRAAEIVLRRAMARPQWLDAAMLLMRTWPARHYSADELARAVGVSGQQFLAALAVHERRPLRQVALELRLDAAREALLATSHGIADIAANTGFSDHAHLTKRFRAAFGTTPSDYRAAYR
jgi:AraC-like DNA-binding protein